MIAKEMRALLPVWAAVAGVVMAASLVGDLHPFTAPLYVIGTAVLGAMSMGHEYSHRTMALMLALPVSRRRMLLTKLAVLAVLLLGLGLLSTVAVTLGRGETVAGRALRWLPVIMSLCVAPALTLASRSPVGGAVFTLGLGGLLMIAGEWIGMLKYGYTRNVDVFRVSFLWASVPLASAAALALMWWGFPRLQVFEGRGDVVDLAPAGRAARSLTKRHPIWLLIGKELRLQQLALIIAAIYLVVFVSIVMGTRGLFYQNEAAFLVSMLYAGLLTAVIGSMSSAEERHLGTSDAQLLLPMPASRQWVVKVSVVLGLTFALAVLLPAAVTTVLHPGPVDWGRNAPTVAGITIVALMSLATVSLYVSTLCSSGVWALVVSVPAAFGVAVFVSKLAEITHGVLYSLDGRLDWAIVRWVFAIMALVVTAVVLRLGFANYRTADRSPGRIATHMGIVAATCLAAAGVVVITGALSR